jgi:hypothetical protein
MSRPTLLVIVLSLTLAACGSEAASGVDAGGASAPEPGSPEHAFRAYRQALRQGDVAALTSHLTEGSAKELEEAGAEKVLPLVRAFLPSETTVVDVEIDGDNAVLGLEGESGGKTARGTARLVRENGAWKIDGEDWNAGDAADEPEEPASEPVDRTPPPEGEWNLDLEGAAIPDRDASGRIKGSDFHVVEAEIQNGILTLRNGAQFKHDAQFIVFLFLNGDDQTIAGRKFAFGPKQDFSAKVNAHVHVHSTKADGAFDVESTADGFSMKLEFGELKDGRLPGRIYLCYPDDERSYVAGRFSAKVPE